jgi:short-subunit dehydrogenase
LPMAGIALVTGASSGIGEALAKELAASGYDLVLAARRKERLEEIAGQLAVKTTVVPVDLAKEPQRLVAEVEKAGIEVDLLVNNAGFGTHGRFVDLDGEREAEEVRLNCEAVVRLTHAFLPGMVRRGKGGVIVIASTAGFQPLPYEATYSATKAFARTFTEALAAELKGTGVRVLCVNPGPVPTEFQAVAGFKEGWMPPVPGAISAAQLAKEVVAAYHRGKRSLVPGALIRWYMRLVAPVPRPIKVAFVERAYRSSL